MGGKPIGETGRDRNPAIQVIGRMFALLDVLASHPDPVSLKYLTERTALHPSTAHRIINDRALAEEIVQEVFLRLWNEPERFDPARGALRSFLLAHVHGRSVDLGRAGSARRSREERDARRAVPADHDLEREVWELTVHEHVRSALGPISVCGWTR